MLQILPEATGDDTLTIYLRITLLPTQQIFNK